MHFRTRLRSQANEVKKVAATRGLRVSARDLGRSDNNSLPTYDQLREQTLFGPGFKIRPRKDSSLLSKIAPFSLLSIPGHQPD